MSYFFLYVYLLPIIFIICYFNRNNVSKSIPFLLIIILGVIRYDTTTDYSAYISAFWDIKKNIYNGHFESGFVAFNRLFTFSKWGFIPMLAVSILIPYVQVYKIFKKYNILIIGSFIFLTFGYFTRFENIVRQGISIGIFYYSLQFAINNKFFKFFLLTALAFLFHASALVLIPYYFLIRFLYKQNTKLKSSLILLLIFYFFYIFNVSQYLLSFVMDNIPFYKVYTEGFEFGEKSSGILLLFKIIIAWLPIYFFKNVNTSPFINLSLNLSWISALGHLIAQDFIVIDRMFEYLYIFQVISISLMIKTLLLKNKTYKFAITFIILFFYMHYRNIEFYYTKNNYQTIFSYNCKENIVYYRYHKWEIENWDLSDNNYRGDTYIIRY